MKNQTIVVGVFVCFLSTTLLAATYGGGLGTTEDPYQIWTAGQMNTIGVNTEDHGKCFILMADIDMSTYTGTQYNVIGSVVNKFTGTFDGNDHVICNLTYSSDSAYYDIGLFGRTSGATIKNLGLKNVSISTGGGWVGGLVGRTESGSITKCFVTGSVKGIMWVGGLVGYNDASVTACYSTGSVRATTDYSTAGGLIGINYGSISACYSTGSVSASSTHVLLGGLVGTNDSSLSACFWDTQTSGQSSGVGSGDSSGVTGKTTTEMQTLSTFTDAGWDFSATDGDAADWWMPTSSYPCLAWESPYGPGSGTSEDPYQIWTDQQMNAIGIYSADWEKSFILMADIDMSTYTGTQYNIIGNESAPFTGSFDGGGHIISNLTYSNSAINHVGLFGKVSLGGQVANLVLSGVNLNGKSQVGGLCGGVATGTISQCSVAGTVTGVGDWIGGLCGYCGNGTINQSYTTVTVAGNNSVGGLCGVTYGTTTSQSYATGAVTGNNSVGGLCGWNYNGLISQSYAAGAVIGNGNVGGFCGDNIDGTITTSFWDINTSGKTSGVGAGNSTSLSGKTTTQMQMLSTFTSAGWDFVEVWAIGNNQTYPYLRQFTAFNPADNDYSGTVDLQDLAILAANWLDGV